MIEWVISIVEGLVLNYGFLGIFFGSVIEEIISFVPSSLIILLASLAILKDVPVNAGSIMLFLGQVVVPVALGLTVGSLVLYGITYYAGEPFLKRFGKY